MAEITYDLDLLVASLLSNSFENAFDAVQE